MLAYFYIPIQKKKKFNILNVYERDIKIINR